MRLLAILWMSIFATTAVAASMPGDDGQMSGSSHTSKTPVDWQKVELEEQMGHRLTRQIAHALPEDKFVVTVAIDLKPPLDKAKRDSSQGTRDGGSRQPALGKLDLDAPLIALMGDGITDNAPTLFDRLAKVRVLVLVDRDVSPEQKKVVEQIARTGLSGFGAGKTDLKVNQAPLVASLNEARKAQLEQDEKKKLEEEKKRLTESDDKKGRQLASEKEKDKDREREERLEREKWDAARWISELKIPLSILGAIFALCFATVTALKENRKLEARKIAILESKNTREESEFQAKQAESENLSARSGATILADGTSSVEERIDTGADGLERFRKLLIEGPERAAALVKQWTRAPGRGASEALTLLPRRLEAAELESLIGFLSSTDRREWKKQLMATFGKKELDIALDFLSSQIVESLIAVSPVADVEFKKALADLKLSECLELCRQDSRAGAVLVNLLPSAQVVRLFSIMPPDLANSLTVESLRLSDEDIQKGCRSLGQVIATMQGKRNVRPFAERASELLKGVGPEKETAILRALAEAGEFEMLEIAARQSFPSELVTRLPAQILKSCLDTLPLARRAELLVAVEEKDRDVLIGAIGAQGSKLREMIELELQQVMGDEARVRRLQKNRDSYWKQFTASVRTIIQGNEMASESADGVLDSWLQELGGGQGSGTGYAA